MKAIEHVRFKLSDLITVVQKKAELPSPPTASSALSYYWNWATGRKWALVSTFCQMDPSTTMLVFEGAQGELRNEEYWNVVWQGEDADGSPDLVEEVGIPRKLNVVEKNVIDVLSSRGWIETQHDTWSRPNGGEIAFIDIAELAAEGYRADAIVRKLEER